MRYKMTLYLIQGVDIQLQECSLIQRGFFQENFHLESDPQFGNNG